MLTLLLAAALAGPPDDLGDVDVLATSPWRVACAAEGPWCRSEGVIDAPIDRLAALLEDVAAYPDLFLRITEAVEIEPMVVHITLRMPFPFASRDYVARFARTRDGEIRRYTWEPTGAAVPAGDAVRLEHAAGEWRLEPVIGGTAVRYTWHGSMGAGFPTWALPRARRVQGEEVLTWLEEAAAR